MHLVDTELIGTARAADHSSFSKRERHVVDAVAMAILPFLVFYSAWGMFGEEFRLYSVSLLNERGLEAYAEPTELNAFGVPLVVALASWGLRILVERFYKRNENKFLGMLVALFEANWMFFAVFSVAQLISNSKTWVSGREVVASLQYATVDLTRWLGDLTALPVEAGYLALLGAIATGWGHLKDGLFEPLLWLAIAAVVFGAEVDRHESLFRKGTRGAQIEEVVTRPSGFIRGVTRFTSRDMLDKYMPVFNALRFVLRVGPVFCLSFCLYYVLVELAFSWLHRGILVFIGPNEFLGWWWQWLLPIDFAVEALHELVRVCLLAATFELTLRLVATKSTGRRARRHSRAV